MTYLKWEEIIPYGVEGIPGDDLGFVFDAVDWDSDDLDLYVSTGSVVSADVLAWYDLL